MHLKRFTIGGKANKYTVDILINNAGLAGISVFEQSTVEYNDLRIQLNIRALVILCRLFIPDNDLRIQLNIRALVILCRLFIPDLKKLDTAYILNTGSLSAYYSIPYKSVYAASKAFVLSFSKALKEELHGTSVSLSVVNPNGVYTNEGAFARIKSHGVIGRMVAISADDLAKITITQMFKGKTVIVPKFANKMLLFLQKLIPYKLKQRILRKEFMKEVKVSQNR